MQQSTEDTNSSPGSPGGVRIGVDVGGTFTDVAVIDETGGAITVTKVSSTPDDFGRGVIEALGQALDRGSVRPDAVTLLAHATTVVTNAILQEKGARIGLVTTRGFRDLLELRRSARADLYDLFQDGPSILAPRRWRMEVTERIGADGTVITPLAEDEIDGLVEGLRAARVEGRGRHPAVLVPQRRPRTPPRSPAARGPAGCSGVPVIGGAARDPGVRTHQHHRGVRLRCSDPEPVPRAAEDRGPGNGTSGPLHHGFGREACSRSRRAWRCPLSRPSPGRLPA